MVHSTFQHPHTPPPHSHTMSTYTVHWEGGGDGGGGQREGTVVGQQYTSIIPSSMGPWGQQLTSWVENTNHE
jgi:hypothetical protein